MPKLETPAMKMLLKVPIINDKIKATVREQMIKAFGGNFAGSHCRRCGFQSGSGTVPAHDRLPLYSRIRHDGMWPHHLLRGLDTLQTRFLRKGCSPHGSENSLPIPENIVGEIVCRGPNVMLGYYKNEEATEEVVDKDGWLHTGDLALMDAEGNVTIKGRSKNMLLGPADRISTPKEEIEDKLNNLPYVAESIIVQQNEKLSDLYIPISTMPLPMG